jgi:hypothetical protein
MTQLQRVLDSAAFVNAPILSRFLRYVVERSPAHDGCALKEYTLGVEVFGRGPRPAHRAHACAPPSCEARYYETQDAVIRS